jgi:hypothetical protein
LEEDEEEGVGKEARREEARVDEGAAEIRGWTEVVVVEEEGDGEGEVEEEEEAETEAEEEAMEEAE